MATRLCLGFCLIISLTTIKCNVVSRLRRIEERLDGVQDRLGGLQERFDTLQGRFDRESKFRREDMRNLFEKIESNSAGFNYSAIDVQCQEPTETSDMSVDWRMDLLQLTMAFKDEKLLNTKLRDRFPNVVDRIQTAEESMSRVEQSIQGVNADIHNVATDVKMVLKEMDINQKKQDNINHEMNTTQMILDNIVNEINTNQMKLDSIVHAMTAHKNESLEIREASITKTDGSISNMEFSNSNNVRPKSCVELYERGIHLSGQYDVYPEGWPIPIRVFCDQDTDGGGWTVFQRRKDGSEDFYREWLDYKNGFGNLDGEFWLGNEYLNILTSDSSHQLRIDMENFDGEKRYAAYDEFQIRSEDEKYTLIVGGYSGNSGDALTYHNGSMFTTKDRDNDSKFYNCAVSYTGAWWYSACYRSNLNGQYVGRKDDVRGIHWYHFNIYSLKFTEMKFK